MGVKAKVMFLGALDAGRHEVYTCPANKAAGIGIFHFKNKTSGNFGLSTSVDRSGDEVELFPDGLLSVAGQTLRDLNFKQVLEAGDKFVIELATGGSGHLYLGGFEQDV